MLVKPLEFPQEIRRAPHLLGRHGILDDDITIGLPVQEVAVGQHAQGQLFLDVAQLGLFRVGHGRVAGTVFAVLIFVLHRCLLCWCETDCAMARRHEMRAERPILILS